MLNILSVDVEDYFHVEAFTSQISPDNWNSFEPRVEQNTLRILELFAKYDAKATFFMLGWVAERFPRLAREIAAAGHEIGSHGYAHRRLDRLTPREFLADITRSTDALVQQVQRPIRCYRAPSFSVVKSTLWALDILAEQGFTFDSSIFPVRHDVYGIPDAKRFPHWRTTAQGFRIFEVPPSTRRFANNNWGVAGGGYLRLMPYAFTRSALRRLNEIDREPGMVYFHPWEIDPDQPVIRTRLRSHLRHYSNLSRMESKIRCLLQDFRFGSLTEVVERHPAYAAAAAPSAASAVTRAAHATAGL
jgi:polysaccharide deacetylase family protein (PEP-CTERM system associated)